VTFDDGYREWGSTVADSLDAFGTSATFYWGAPFRADVEGLYPLDAWYFLLDHAAAPNLTIRVEGHDVEHLDLSTVAGKTRALAGPARNLLIDGSDVQRTAFLAMSSESGSPPAFLATTTRMTQ
jgi:hypothetical protein